MVTTVSLDDFREEKNTQPGPRPLGRRRRACRRVSQLRRSWIRRSKISAQKNPEPASNRCLKGKDNEKDIHKDRPSLDAFREAAKGLPTPKNPTPNAERKFRNSPIGGEQRFQENAVSSTIFGRQQQTGRTETGHDETGQLDKRDKSIPRRLQGSCEARRTPAPRKLRRLENSGASKTPAPRKLRRLENSGASKLRQTLSEPRRTWANRPSLDDCREAVNGRTTPTNSKLDELSAEATLPRAPNCHLPPAISGQSVCIYPHLAFMPAVVSPPASGRRGRIDPHLALSQP